MERLVEVARRAGTQDCDCCPPVESCWLGRNREQIIEGDVVDTECANCIADYLLNGGGR